MRTGIRMTFCHHFVDALRNKITAHRLRWAAITGVLVARPDLALATQGHGGIEGVWIHQFAHLFFLFAMLLLIYWLRRAGLVREPGWRYIQYAALFFTFWNLDTLFVHFLDEQIQAVRVVHSGDWTLQIHAVQGKKGLAALYYVAKLDHLLCVPAMVCLMLGLRHMVKANRPDEAAKAVR